MVIKIIIYIRWAGLGVRGAALLTASAYLVSSAAGTIIYKSHLTHFLLDSEPSRIAASMLLQPPGPEWQLIEVFSAFLTTSHPPATTAQRLCMGWTLLQKSIWWTMLLNASDPVDRVRLPASWSGDFLRVSASELHCSPPHRSCVCGAASKGAVNGHDGLSRWNGSVRHSKRNQI